MIRFKGKFRKFLAAALIASVCGVMSAATVYADGPSGPASDTQIAEHSKNEASGPGAVQPEQQQVPPEQPPVPPEQPPVPPEQQQVPPEQPAVPPEQSQPDPSADGKVMSGGRWIDPSKPMVALTFDDGPYAPVGNRIMDVLEQYNGRSTFFVVGNRVSQYKTEIRRMHENGHEVANHTYEHKYLTKLGAAEIRSQIERCNEAIAAVTGASPKLVRLPGGLKNATVLANVHYPVIMWNIDTKDWKTKNAQKSINAVLGSVKDGDIVLMHELYTASGDAAAAIIPALSEQGYQLVTVSEMAGFRGGMSAGNSYNKFRP